jgi:Zn-dependent peptidase ImmA (M78 family)
MNGKEEVWERVEAFRRQYLVGELAHLPVDVFTLAELEFKLDIIPFDDLYEKYEVDAALIQNFSGIYVDAEAYIIWEKGPRWKQRRLRFSVAHELGHYVLHREIAAKLKFRTFGDFALWTKGNHGQKYTLEQTANEFAGRLLVPVDRLRAAFESFANVAKDVIPNWSTSPDMRHGFAEKLREQFEVNTPVIETRLDREDIWPPC